MHFNNIIKNAAIAAVAFLLGTSTAFANNISNDKTKVFELSEGSDNAPVQVVIYESFTCPHCMQYAIGTHDKIAKEFISNNKVKVTTRTIPMDQVGFKASMLMYCMYQQKGANAAAAFRKAVFANMPSLVSSIHNLSKHKTEGGETTAFYNSFLTFAELGGAARSALTACVDSDDAQNVLIESKMHAVNTMGINAIPTVFINSNRIEGGLTLDQWRAAINKELEKNKSGSLTAKGRSQEKASKSNNTLKMLED